MIRSEKNDECFVGRDSTGFSDCIDRRGHFFRTVSMYDRWKPAGMLWVWGILGVRLCVLYPLVYKIFAGDLQPGSPSYAATTDLAQGMTAHPYLSVSLSVRGANAVFWIWITGVGLFLGIHFIRFQVTMKKLLNHSKKISNLYDFSLKYGLPAKLRWKKVEVRCCGAMNGPMLIGFCKKYLLMPEKVLDNQDMQLLLRHEFIYFEKKDIWLKQFFLICNSLHWFNPVIYWMRIRATEMIELACDYEVVKNLDAAERKSYAELLYYTLQSTQKGAAISSVALSAKAKALKAGFMNIVNTKKRKNGICVYMGAFLFLFVLQSVLYVEVCADAFQFSFVELQHAVDGTAYLQTINFSDLYYLDEECQDYEQLGKNDELILESGEGISLYLSSEGEMVKLNAGDVIHIQIQVRGNTNLWLKLDSIEKELRDIKRGEAFVVRRDVEGPIQLINYSPENVVVY